MDNDGGMVEKLRSEVKRIVVERMKEEAAVADLLHQKKTTSTSDLTTDVPRTKGTFIIRMDDKGAIVTEAVESHMESYSGSTLEEGLAALEEKRLRKTFISLLRMTVHLLLALQEDKPPSASQDSQSATQTENTGVDLSLLAEDVRRVIEMVFASNGVELRKGVSRHTVDQVLSNFRLLWPENILPDRYFTQLEVALLSLARKDSPAEEGTPSPVATAERNERLMQFMRSIRGEFASHLRQFSYTGSVPAVADRSGLNGAHEPKPNRTPDEL